MVLVKITSSESGTVSLDVDNNDVGNFIIDIAGESNARSYLLKLMSEGVFETHPEWNERSFLQQFEVNVPSLNMEYILAADTFINGDIEPQHTPQTEQFLSITNGDQSQQQPIPINIGGPTYWSHNAILFLISQWKEFEAEFKNTSIRKETTWKKIAQNLKDNAFGSPTPRQVEDKWKNLRKSYIKIKDNRGPNSSGAPATNFKYFDEMDEIFCHSPAVQPPAIASSRRPNHLPEPPEPNENTPLENSTHRNRKRKTYDDQINTFIEEQKKRTNILRELKDATNVLVGKLDTLIEKL